MAEITHQRDEDGRMVQLVTPERLREILDAEGSDYSRPSDFTAADEWEVDSEWEDEIHYTTVGEYQDAHEECTGEFFGQNGELLDRDAPIMVQGDEWAAGHDSANATWEVLE